MYQNSAEHEYNHSTPASEVYEEPNQPPAAAKYERRSLHAGKGNNRTNYILEYQNRNFEIPERSLKSLPPDLTTLKPTHPQKASELAQNPKNAKMAQRRNMGLYSKKGSKIFSQAKYNEDDYENLQKSKAEKLRFVDFSFDHNFKNLKIPHNFSPEEDTIEWLRASDVFETTGFCLFGPPENYKKRRFFGGDYSRLFHHDELVCTNVMQSMPEGMTKFTFTPYLNALGLLLNVVDFKHFRRIFEVDEADQGVAAYSVKLNIAGIWTQFIVDDYFPVLTKKSQKSKKSKKSKNLGKAEQKTHTVGVFDHNEVDSGVFGVDEAPKTSKKLNFLYCSPVEKTNEIWMMVLEKALAKAYGGYEKLRRGSVDQYLENLTGAPTEIFSLSEHETDQEMLILWRKIQSALCKSYIVAVNAQKTLENCLINFDDFQPKDGVYYLIQGISTHNDTHYVLLTNPNTPKTPQKVPLKFLVKNFKNLLFLKFTASNLYNSTHIPLSALNYVQSVVKIGIQEPGRYTFRLNQKPSSFYPKNSPFCYNKLSITLARLEEGSIEHVKHLVDQKRRSVCLELGEVKNQANYVLLIDLEADKKNYVYEKNWKGDLQHWRDVVLSVYGTEYVRLDSLALDPNRGMIYDFFLHRTWKHFSRRFESSQWNRRQLAALAKRAAGAPKLKNDHKKALNSLKRLNRRVWKVVVEEEDGEAVRLIREAFVLPHLLLYKFTNHSKVHIELGDLLDQKLEQNLECFGPFEVNNIDPKVVINAGSSEILLFKFNSKIELVKAPCFKDSNFELAVCETMNPEEYYGQDPFDYMARLYTVQPSKTYPPVYFEIGHEGFLVNNQDFDDFLRSGGGRAVAGVPGVSAKPKKSLSGGLGANLRGVREDLKVTFVVSCGVGGAAKDGLNGTGEASEGSRGNGSRSGLEKLGENGFEVGGGLRPKNGTGVGSAGVFGSQMVDKESGSPGEGGFNLSQVKTAEIGPGVNIEDLLRERPRSELNGSKRSIATVEALRKPKNSSKNLKNGLKIEENNFEKIAKKRSKFYEVKKESILELEQAKNCPEICFESQIQANTQPQNSVKNEVENAQKRASEASLGHSNSLNLISGDGSTIEDEFDLEACGGSSDISSLGKDNVGLLGCSVDPGESIYSIGKLGVGIPLAAALKNDLKAENQKEDSEEKLVSLEVDNGVYGVLCGSVGLGFDAGGMNLPDNGLEGFDKNSDSLGTSGPNAVSMEATEVLEPLGEEIVVQKRPRDGLEGSSDEDDENDFSADFGQRDLSLSVGLVPKTLSPTSGARQPPSIDEKSQESSIYKKGQISQNEPILEADPNTNNRGEVPGVDNSPIIVQNTVETHGKAENRQTQNSLIFQQDDYMLIRTDSEDVVIVHDDDESPLSRPVYFEEESKSRKIETSQKSHIMLKSQKTADSGTEHTSGESNEGAKVSRRSRNRSKEVKSGEIKAWQKFKFGDGLSLKTTSNGFLKASGTLKDKLMLQMRQQRLKTRPKCSRSPSQKAVKNGQASGSEGEQRSMGTISGQTQASNHSQTNRKSSKSSNRTNYKLKENRAPKTTQSYQNEPGGPFELQPTLKSTTERDPLSENPKNQKTEKSAKQAKTHQNHPKIGIARHQEHPPTPNGPRTPTQPAQNDPISDIVTQEADPSLAYTKTTEDFRMSMETKKCTLAITNKAPSKLQPLELHEESLRHFEIIEDAVAKSGIQFGKDEAQEQQFAELMGVGGNGAKSIPVNMEMRAEKPGEAREAFGGRFRVVNDFMGTVGCVGDGRGYERVGDGVVNGGEALELKGSLAGLGNVSGGNIDFFEGFETTAAQNMINDGRDEPEEVRNGLQSGRIVQKVENLGNGAPHPPPTPKPPQSVRNSSPLTAKLEKVTKISRGILSEQGKPWAGRLIKESGYLKNTKRGSNKYNNHSSRTNRGQRSSKSHSRKRNGSKKLSRGSKSRNKKRGQMSFLEVDGGGSGLGNGKNLSGRGSRGRKKGFGGEDETQYGSVTSGNFSSIGRQGAQMASFASARGPNLGSLGPLNDPGSLNFKKKRSSGFDVMKARNLNMRPWRFKNSANQSRVSSRSRDGSFLAQKKAIKGKLKIPRKSRSRAKKGSSRGPLTRYRSGQGDLRPGRRPGPPKTAKNGQNKGTKNHQNRRLRGQNMRKEEYGGVPGGRSGSQSRRGLPQKAEKRISRSQSKSKNSENKPPSLVNIEKNELGGGEGGVQSRQEMNLEPEKNYIFIQSGLPKIENLGQEEPISVVPEYEDVPLCHQEPENYYEDLTKEQIFETCQNKNLANLEPESLPAQEQTFFEDTKTPQTHQETATNAQNSPKLQNPKNPKITISDQICEFRDPEKVEFCNTKLVECHPGIIMESMEVEDSFGDLDQTSPNLCSSDLQAQIREQIYLKSMEEDTGSMINQPELLIHPYIVQKTPKGLKSGGTGLVEIQETLEPSMDSTMQGGIQEARNGSQSAQNEYNIGQKCQKEHVEVLTQIQQKMHKEQIQASNLAPGRPTHHQGAHRQGREAENRLEMPKTVNPSNKSSDLYFESSVSSSMLSTPLGTQQGRKGPTDPTESSKFTKSSPEDTHPKSSFYVPGNTPEPSLPPNPIQKKPYKLADIINNTGNLGIRAATKNGSFFKKIEEIAKNSSIISKAGISGSGEATETAERATNSFTMAPRGERLAVNPYSQSPARAGLGGLQRDSEVDKRSSLGIEHFSVGLRTGSVLNDEKFENLVSGDLGSMVRPTYDNRTRHGKETPSDVIGEFETPKVSFLGQKMKNREIEFLGKIESKIGEIGGGGAGGVHNMAAELGLGPMDMERCSFGQKQSKREIKPLRKNKRGSHVFVSQDEGFEIKENSYTLTQFKEFENSVNLLKSEDGGTLEGTIEAYVVRNGDLRARNEVDKIEKSEIFAKEIDSRALKGVQGRQLEQVVVNSEAVNSPNIERMAQTGFVGKVRQVDYNCRTSWEDQVFSEYQPNFQPAYVPRSSRSTSSKKKLKKRQNGDNLKNGGNEISRGVETDSRLTEESFMRQITIGSYYNGSENSELGQNPIYVMEPKHHLKSGKNDVYEHQAAMEHKKRLPNSSRAVYSDENNFFDVNQNHDQNQLNSERNERGASKSFRRVHKTGYAAPKTDKNAKKAKTIKIENKQDLYSKRVKRAVLRDSQATSNVAESKNRQQNRGKAQINQPKILRISHNLNERGHQNEAKKGIQSPRDPKSINYQEKLRSSRNKNRLEKIVIIGESSRSNSPRNGSTGVSKVSKAGGGVGKVGYPPNGQKIGLNQKNGQRVNLAKNGHEAVSRARGRYSGVGYRASSYSQARKQIKIRKTQKNPESGIGGIEGSKEPRASNYVHLGAGDGSTQHKNWKMGKKVVIKKRGHFESFGTPQGPNVTTSGSKNVMGGSFRASSQETTRNRVGGVIGWNSGQMPHSEYLVTENAPIKSNRGSFRVSYYGKAQ